MKLQGGINFRDMGGYLTQDGRRVKKGVFFRSGALSRLTEADCDTLHQASVRHILDYRDHHESLGERDVLWTGVEYECCPANPSSHTTQHAGDEFFSDRVLSAFPQNFMEGLYRRLPFANRAYQRLIYKAETLQEGALVHHCAVGKDRTGVGSAILLLSLGVKEEAVIEDYLITEQTLQPYRTEVFQKIGTNLSQQAVDNFHHVMSASEHFLRTAFQAIHEKYGSIDHYLQAEFDLTTERRDKLKNQHLE